MDMAGSRAAYTVLSTMVRCPKPDLSLVTTTLFAAALLGFAPFTAEGQDDTDQPHKLVLVLSGGGARGVAHVGVLRVLEELHVVPDMVVGTSMGAIVGGLYAAGWTPDDIEYLVDALDWEQIFTDSVDRRDLPFRRKQDDRPVMIQGRLHFKGLKPTLPSGAIAGQRLGLVLQWIEAVSPTADDFDRLSIPFRAVAADIASGEAVVIDSGRLSTAMRASMSIPGAVPPVVLDGRQLVDGGVAANLPVGIARDLGATAVIAVDISSPLLSADESLGSFMEIYTHLNSLLTVQNRDRDVALLGPEDLLIQPELGDISFVSFDRVHDAASIGEQATRARADELRRYVSSEELWQEFTGRERARPRDPIEIDTMRLENTSRVDDRIISDALGIEPPTAIDGIELGLDLLELYDTRAFGVVGFRIEEDDGNRTLVVETPPPVWGRGSVQFGIGFLDDFDGGSSYHLQLRHQLLAANRRGGEWQSFFQVGIESIAAVEFYQPLDVHMRWFVVPSIGYRRRTQELWLEGDAITQYQLKTTEARLAAGRVLGRWGELRVGAYTSDNSGSPRIGLPAFPSFDERRGGAELGFRVDARDEVVFPRAGTEVDAWYERSYEALGADTEFERVWAAASHAWSIGEYTLVPYLEYGENLEEAQSLLDLFALGGIGRLSGLGERELLGEKVALARLLGYRRLWGLDLAGIKMRLYAGLSLEAGNTFEREASVTWDTLINGWGVFVGANTPLGPVYLSYGRVEGGRDRVYFAIGERF
jgi:NTE family protein